MDTLDPKRTATLIADPATGRGIEQRVRILQSAREVFLRDGPAKFSSRAVAKEAQIRLSSVQHFFSTTDELLIAMLRFVESLHTEIYESMEAKLPFNVIQRLRAVIDYLLQDLFKPDTTRFYFGLFSLGLHNKKVAVFIDEAFAQHRNTLAVLIGGARPDLTETRCRDLATHIAALIEGLMVYIPHQGLRGHKRDEFIQSAQKSIWALIGADGRVVFPAAQSTRT